MGIGKSKIIPDIKNKNISEDKIEEYVLKLLTNKDINNHYIPDIAERKIYKDTIILIMNILNETLETSSVKILGHKIKFSIEPDI